MVNVCSDAGSGLAQFKPSPPSARLKLSAANRGVGEGVGVGVGVAVGVGVGEGVAVAQLSLPMVINVPGELWLLYSVVIQVALRVDELNLTSSRYVAGQNTVSSDCAIK